MKTRSTLVTLTTALLLSGPAAALADKPVEAAASAAVPAAAPTAAPTAAPAAPPAAPSTPAAASPSGSGGEQSTSRILFDAGSRAYAAGNYRAAIQAFEQALSAEARPGLLFSIAQAHRRQYKIDGRAGHIAVAMRRYREYLAQVKQGGRRADVEAALAELEPVAQKLEQEGQLLSAAAQESETATRLIVTSPVAGAKVLVDDDKTPRDVPFIAEVTAGRHKLRVLADDHFEEAREIEVAAGAVTALDLALKERPATLALESVSGARVSLDGRFLGETPLPGGVEIPSGDHRLEVSRAGYASFTQALRVSPGQKVTVTAPLVMTFQRKVSVGLMIGGGAAVAGGVVLGGLALASQADAASVKGAMDRGEVVCRGDSCPELDRYNGAVSARDALRATSFTLLGVGALAAGGGVFLYFVDGLPLFGAPRGDASSPPAASAAGGQSSHAAREPARVQLSATPLLAPGLGGVSVSGRF